MAYFDESRIKKAINEENRTIESVYAQIGQTYYASHKDEADNEFAGLFGVIKNSENNIKNYKVQLLDLKGLIECPNCHAEISKLSPFCNQCGKPVPVPEGKVRCPQCGNLSDKGSLFCMTCGFQLALPETPARPDPSQYSPLMYQAPAQPQAPVTPMTPVVETPVVETPVVETPAVETPTVETPVVETPAVETPAVETPVEPQKMELPFYGAPVQTEEKTETVSPEQNVTKCPNCGNAVPEGFAFCTECGTPVVFPARAAAPEKTGRKCAKCGNAVPEGFAFCTECGTPVTAPAPAGRVCPNCGRPVPEGFAFCTECGTKL